MVVARDQENLVDAAAPQFVGNVVGFVERRNRIAWKRLEIGFGKAVGLRVRNRFIRLIREQVGIAADQSIRSVSFPNQFARGQDPLAEIVSGKRDDGVRPLRQFVTNKKTTKASQNLRAKYEADQDDAA
jgi:hypothetical protein